MKKKNLVVPAAQDIVRVIASTPAETEDRLLAYYTDPSGGFFSYRAAHGLSRYAFGRSIALEQILHSCERQRNKQGRICNMEVVRMIWNLAEKRSVVTYELPPKKLALRQDLSIRVAPPFYFVEDGKPSVFWLQPRKTHALSYAEMGLLASLIKATYLVDDYEGLGFEICDLSAPLGKVREPRTYTLSDFQLLSDAEVEYALQLFANAYDALRARGIEPRRRAPKRPDADPGGLF